MYQILLVPTQHQRRKPRILLCAKAATKRSLPNLDTWGCSRGIQEACTGGGEPEQAASYSSDSLLLNIALPTLTSEGKESQETASLGCHWNKQVQQSVIQAVKQRRIRSWYAELYNLGFSEAALGKGYAVCSMAIGVEMLGVHRSSIIFRGMPFWLLLTEHSDV